MITHIVLFKLKDNSTESIEKARDILMDMKGKIPELNSIEVGIDVTHSDRSYDLALITKFASARDLEAYQVHPVHVKVAEYILSVRAFTVTVDFESS